MNEKQKNEAIRRGVLQEEEYVNEKRDVSRRIKHLKDEVNNMARLPEKEFSFQKFVKNRKEDERKRVIQNELGHKISEVKKVTKEIAMSVGDFDGQMDFFNKEENIDRYNKNPDDFIRQRLTSKKNKKDANKTKEVDNPGKGRRVSKKRN